MKSFLHKIVAHMVIIAMTGTAIPEMVKVINHKPVNACCCLSQGKVCHCAHKNTAQLKADQCSISNVGCGSSKNENSVLVGIEGIVPEAQQLTLIPALAFEIGLISLVQVTSVSTDVFRPPPVFS